MTKEELLEQFNIDFKKTQGALTEVLEHNRAIDDTLLDDLVDGEHGKIEEHIEISKIIMSGVKGFNELYANAPKVLESIDKLPEEGSGDKKPKIDLAEVLNNID